ncbi:MAG: hypothetical protein R2821_05075 [Flavobacteriaceae bacterium]
MDNINTFLQIKNSLKDLKEAESLNHKIDNLIQITLDVNELNKIIYESYINSSNMNKKIFDAISETLLKITKRLDKIEIWSNEQNELNEIRSNTNNIRIKSFEQINENINLLMKITDNFSEHLEIIENRLDLLS